MASNRAVKKVNSECYAIEKILDSRTNKESQLEYLIKWKDFPASENSWQLVDDLFSKKKTNSNALNANDDDTSDDELLQTPVLRKRTLQSVVQTQPDDGDDTSGDEKIVARPSRKRKLQTQSEKAKSKRVQDEEISEASVEPPRAKRVRKNGPQSVLASISGEITPKTRKISETSSNNEDENREVDSVQSLRKRKDRHEYLVKWKNSDDKEWIARDIMVQKYPESVIAFFQSIIVFK